MAVAEDEQAAVRRARARASGRRGRASWWPWPKTSVSTPARAKLVDHAVGPAADVVGALAARDTVPPERPVRPLGTDLGGRPALVLAVVPLGQVLADLGSRTEARELAGLACAPQRARQNEAERAAVQGFAEEPGLRPPSSSNGRSVRPVCWRVRVHSVSPWRTRTTSVTATSRSVRSRGRA